jgi:hypothetical protein
MCLEVVWCMHHLPLGVAEFSIAALNLYQKAEHDF